MNKFLIFIVLASLTVSCRSIREAKRLVSCDFAFRQVVDTQIGGVKIQEKENVRDLGFGEMALITKQFMTGSLPLTFKALIDIRNPNSKIAALNKLEWKMYVEGEFIAEGVIDKRFEVPGGQTTTVPVNVELDILDIWKTKNMNNILNLLFNLSDMGGRPTTLTLKVRPSVIIAGREVHTPNFFSIDTEFGD